MAHFAQLDENNIVTQVVVVADKNTADSHGVEKEEIGIAFLERLLSGTWKQTSYNGNFRKNYAGIGYTYDPSLDAFIPPKPFNSWILNTDLAQWEAPVAMPTDGIYFWDEASTSWQPSGNSD